MPHSETAAREHEPRITLRYSYRDPCPHQRPGSRRQAHPHDRTYVVARIPQVGALGHPRLGDETAKRDLQRAFGAHPENSSTRKFQATGFGPQDGGGTPPGKTNIKAMPLPDG